jgi:uncharacterized protein YjbJ (UPF0337 family)
VGIYTERRKRRHTVGLEDKARNTADTAKGKAKDVAGRVTGDKDLESEGKADQVVGHLKQAGEKVKDAVSSAVPDDKK